MPGACVRSGAGALPCARATAAAARAPAAAAPSAAGSARPARVRLCRGGEGHGELYLERSQPATLPLRRRLRYPCPAARCRVRRCLVVGAAELATRWVHPAAGAAWGREVRRVHGFSQSAASSSHSQPRALRHTTVRHHGNTPVRVELMPPGSTHYTIYANRCPHVGSALCLTARAPSVPVRVYARSARRPAPAWYW